MIITRLELRCFRNHIHTDVRWAERLNVITGPNGAGKTNLIDAIHYLCMSRSFVASTDQYVISAGQKRFSVEGHFEGTIRSSFSVGCSYARGEGKKITVNESPLDKLSDLIGRVPVVVLSPDDKKLTSEGPAERRSFLDAFIAQLSPAYLRDLIDFRRVLKQRNSLLGDQRMQITAMEALIEPWNEQLIASGSRIVHRRAEVLAKFEHFLDESYELIAGIGHRPHFEYKTFCTDVKTPEIIADSYRKMLVEAFDKERERQQTTIGPHRDDIVFYLDDKELRKFGSQGQHRLFALALKLAQRAYYAEELEDLPIFLLDDVFGDLDPQKTKILVDMLKSEPGQTFITAANRNLFAQMVNPQENHIHFYEISDGRLTCNTQNAAVSASELTTTSFVVDTSAENMHTDEGTDEMIETED